MGKGVGGSEEPACAKALRLEETWPIPGTESRPKGLEPKREAGGSARRGGSKLGKKSGLHPLGAVSNY